MDHALSVLDVFRSVYRKRTFKLYAFCQFWFHSGANETWFALWLQRLENFPPTIRCRMNRTSSRTRYEKTGIKTNCFDGKASGTKNCAVADDTEERDFGIPLREDTGSDWMTLIPFFSATVS